MNVVRVGFIGAGSMANAVHYPSIVELKEAQLVAICDLDEERLNSTAEKYGVPKEQRYTDYRQMLEREDLDAIYVIMPPMGLKPIVLDCLRFGKHVFIEKPIGCTSEDAWAMAEEAERRKVKTCVGFNRRYAPVYQYAKAKVFEFDIPSLAFAEFHKDMLGQGPYYGMSILRTDIIHVVDLLRDLLGDPIEVYAHVWSKYERWENSHNQFAALIRFEGKAVGILAASRTSGSRYERFEIHGKGISAYIRAPEQAEIHRQGADIEIVTDEQLVKTTDRRITYGYFEESRHFINCILQDELPITNFTDAAKTMDLVERIEKFALP
ncbi:MAG: Gfo/Idh/MocA family oxidoreductase [Armatimonadetes bacterium]|nr:Gfo/Idh/MocA family oxidoreductase [Armatimonadota bacterium]